jgi:hypothetical protein
MKIRNKSVNTLNSKQIYIIYLYNLLPVYFIGKSLLAKKTDRAKGGSVLNL